ncbi:hypothetical protein [Acidisoma cladoniae]|uniref:hypothetical protein n=1 Tax=Acidisoma cladoniae TaxID=3040935 RepID=UPI00254F0515|nr:hypothetical protein [Acidisoma sp. PAMC 29798]
MFVVIPSFFLLAGGIAAAGTLSPENPDQAKLQQMVTNLGYDTTLSPSGKSIQFKLQQGNYVYPTGLQINPSHTLAYAYADLITYDSAQLAKLNLTKLLEENNSADFYFSMEKKPDGKGEELYANAVIPMSGISPQILRNLFQNMTDSLAESAQVWDSSLWK